MTRCSGVLCASLLTILLFFICCGICSAQSGDTTINTENTTEYSYPITDAETMPAVKERAAYLARNIGLEQFNTILATYPPVSEKQLASTQISALSSVATTSVLFSGGSRKNADNSEYYVKIINSLALTSLPEALTTVANNQLMSLFKTINDASVRNFADISELRSQYNSSLNQLDRQNIKKRISSNENEFYGISLAGHAFSDYALHDYTGCKTSISKALDYDSDNSGYYFLRALAKSADGETNGALDDYTSALKYAPGYFDAAFNRAALYAQNGETDKAVADYTTCISIRPDSVACYNQRAILYYNQGKFDLAFADFNRSVAFDPRNVTALTYRSELLMRQKLYDLAITDYSSLIKIDPSNAKYYLNRGNAFYAKGDAAAAVADYQKAADLGIGDSSLFLNIGNIYFDQNKYDDAIGAYNKYLATNARDSNVYIRLGACFDAKKEYDKAIVEYTNALAYTKTSQLYFLRANDYFTAAVGNPALYDSAVADCNEILNLEPNNSDALLLRAKANRLQNKNDAAIADYSKVVELNPSGPKTAEAYCGRAWCYADKGGNSNNIHATQDFQKARIVDPTNPLYDYYMADFYDKIRRAKSDTVNAYKSFIKKAGDNPVYTEKSEYAKKRVTELGGTL